VQLDLNGSFKVDELQLRYRRRAFPCPAHITTCVEAAAFLQPILGDRPREVLVTIALNPMNDVIGLEFVSTGGTNQAFAIPGEIFKALLLCNASAFIMAHNHPSGHAEPSEQDRALSAMVNHAARMLGIKMLDSLVITRDDFHSLESSDPDWRTHAFNPGEGP
jgi:DNA repair protein RadC